jgi:nucleotide-binding universal stress UspA family protein
MATMAMIAPVRVGFKRILMPTDFSLVSKNALELAKSIASADDATILLAHATEETNPISPPELVWFDKLHCESGCQGDEEAKLECWASKLRAERLKSKTHLVVGTVRDRMPRLVRQEEVDLIVMGTHARTGISRLFMGSATEALVREATCPVLVVGPDVQASERKWPPRKILCASDLELESLPEAAYAGALAQSVGAEFSIVHVGDPEGRGATLKQQLRFANALRSEHANVAVPSFFDRGLAAGHSIASTVTEVAEQWDFNLIVMGSTPNQASVSRLRCGILTQALAHARCPVMILPRAM